MFDACIGTADRVHLLGDAQLEPLGLEGERIMAIHAWREGPDLKRLAGSYGDGLYPRTGEGWSRAATGLTADALRD